MLEALIGLGMTEYEARAYLAQLADSHGPQPPARPAARPTLQRRYLDLLRNTLSNRHYALTDRAPFREHELAEAEAALARVRQRYGSLVSDSPQASSALSPQEAVAVKAILNGTTAPELAAWLRIKNAPRHTMLDEASLQNVEDLATDVLKRKVPGDFMECGVWRGGLTIFMRGLLEAHRDRKRRVWVADSFQGLPEPDADLCPVDAVSHEILRLTQSFSVSLEAVQEHFRLYGLLDEQVRFLPGWFNETIPTAPIKQLALLRLDADYYESTVPLLEHLYPKLSAGGYAIIDDYGIASMGARRAVDEYRAKHQIVEPMQVVNAQCVYWQKQPRG